ncbi:MAG: immunoglobulin domain-containing protein [Verrucomicrobiota bacterium]
MNSGIGDANNKVGRCFIFDGTGDGVNVGASLNFDFQNYTIEGWVKLANAARPSEQGNKNGTIFSAGSWGAYNFYIQSDGYLATGQNAVYPLASTLARITDTAWHHVALTKSGSTFKFYLDGALKSTHTYVAGEPSYLESAYIGAWVHDGYVDNSLNGRIDELAIYNQSLDSTQIQNIFAASSAGKCPLPPTAPTIVIPPASQTVIVGQNVTLRVAATGGRPMAYQWFQDGIAIGAATSSLLQLNNVQPGQSGNYSVRVVNEQGPITSANAQLTVKPAPVATIWVDDQPLPANGYEQSYNETWDWYDYWYDVDASGGWYYGDVSPQSGNEMHVSGLVDGDFHQHYFDGTSQQLRVNPGDTLFAYINIDPAYPPTEIMLQWHDTQSGWWDHRAYWGANELEWGVDGTESRYCMGALPQNMGEWIRLEVPASLVGLEGLDLDGMAFTLNNGRAAWDSAGKISSDDYDNDNMSDEWERYYFANTLQKEPWQDYDLDGISNLQEYYRGTNPTTSSSGAFTWYADSLLGNDSYNGRTATWNGTSGPFASITRAILGTLNGDLVSVNAGTYSENIDLRGKPIQLQINGSVTLH